jgi:hypothetical protein
VTINSVELGETTINDDGCIQLDLPGWTVRDLNDGRLTVRPIVVPCPPSVICPFPREQMIIVVSIETPRG